MRRTHSTSAASGWEWNAHNGPTPQPPPHRTSRPPRGTAAAVFAAIAFLGVLGVAGAVLIGASQDDSEDPVAMGPSSPAPAGEGAASSTPVPAVTPADARQPKPRPIPPRSQAEIAWTTDTPATLRDLARTWSIPRDVLGQLNPDLSMRQPIAAGTSIIVYAQALGASSSVGPPNDGRLVRGVPLPEDEAWTLPEDRSRAFATTETIAAMTAAMDAYGQRFPGASPIQLGDLSARRGGRLSGHQSHQSGRDVDIRLIENDDGDGFHAERNWFLVKTVIDNSDVRAIFLNRGEQTWLRAAAEADVGPASAAEYFALIRHEPGHTIHMHIRFACAKRYKRCVGYSLPDTAEHDPDERSKLPRCPGNKPRRPGLKLPGKRR